MRPGTERPWHSGNAETQPEVWSHVLSITKDDTERICCPKIFEHIRAQARRSCRMFARQGRTSCKPRSHRGRQKEGCRHVRVFFHGRCSENGCSAWLFWSFLSNVSHAYFLWDQVKVCAGKPEFHCLLILRTLVPDRRRKDFGVNVSAKVLVVGDGWVDNKNCCSE